MNLPVIPRDSPEERIVSLSQAMVRFAALRKTPPEQFHPDEIRDEVVAELAALALPDTDFFAVNVSSGASIRVSQLNRAGSGPHARPTSLVFDEPLRPMPGMRYDFAHMDISVEQPTPFLFELDGVDRVIIENVEANLSVGPSGFARLMNCHSVELRNNRINHFVYGIALRDDNHHIAVRDNVLSNGIRAAIYLQGENHHVLIGGNQIDTLETSSNGAAGIVLYSVMIHDRHDLARDFWPDYHWPLPSPIRRRLRAAHRVVVSNNTIRRSKTSGMYIDGAYENCIVENRIEECDKEGICLDNGSFLNHVAGNVLSSNGRRIRQSDFDLHLDFIDRAGRIEDGSSPAKVPGISMDNAVHNIIRNNVITGNYGGGVKMVRTCFFNRVEGNVIEHNNPWSDDYWHYFGVSVDGAKPDTETPEHDFFSSHGNVVRDNVISGHYSGIHVSGESAFNRITGNVLSHHKWGIEHYSTGRNLFSGNQSAQPNRGTKPLYASRKKLRTLLRRLVYGDETPKPQVSPEFLDYRGRVIIDMARSGRVEEAILEGETLLGEHPGLVWFRGHLAHWLKETGRMSRALEEYERIVKDNPSDEAARELLNAVRRQIP